MWRENEMYLTKFVVVSYNWNAGLVLDTDLTLLLLRRGAHRLASVLEREATQARV